MDDLELLTEYFRGSEEAFATLVRRHLNAVYSVAFRVLRSHALAEEVAFSTFHELARSRVKPVSPLIAWLFCVARRTALDALKREIRRERRETAARESSSPEHFPGSSEMVAALDGGLEQLTPADRDILFLRFYEEQSFRAIASTLNISAGAAEKRIQRALERLRERMKKAERPIQSTTMSAAWAQFAGSAPPAETLATLVSSIPSPVSAVASRADLAFMTTTQKTVAALALTAFIGTALYQRGQIQALRHQTELSRRFAEATSDELVRAREELRLERNGRFKTREEHLELLSLRGRMQQLRDEIQSLRRPQGEGRAIADNTNPPDSILFSVALTNQIPPGQSLVAGGWRTEGLRRFLVLTPEVHTDATNDEVIAVKSQMIAAPETFWQSIGWGEAASEQHRSTVTGLLGQADVDALLASVKNAPGGEFSNVSLANRKEGEVIGLGFSVDNEVGSGTMCSLSVYPKMGADRLSVILEIVPLDLGTNAAVHPSLRNAAM